MQVVILAGGLGTRLWPMTKSVPKPMVPVGGEPYLAHQLRFLRGQGYSDVVILTGYLGEQIEDYFGDGSAVGMRIQYSREPGPLGTGGALRNASELLGDAFLLIYGDSFLPIEYGILERRLAETQATAVVALFEDPNGETGVVVAGPDGERVFIASTSGPQDFSPSRLGDVETMHAMTIHKSQGSQANEVTVLMPPVQSRLLTRELFYTAVTRAKRKVRVVGSADEVRAAIDRRAVRATGLALRLRG